MHDLAIVAKIQALEPIAGKDRIVLATICNYKSIVQKGEYNVGDLAINIFYDSILPVRPEFEFLRKRCWSEKYQGFRIRPMKMGPVVSEGLVLPLSLCKGAKEGDIVTEKLEIRRYDAEATFDNLSLPSKGLKSKLMRYLLFKKLFCKEKDRSYPIGIPKSDEENIEKVFDFIKDSHEEFILTEKVEGASAMYYLKKKAFGWDYRIHSHNYRVFDGSWKEFSDRLHVKDKLISYAKRNGIKEIAISGELIGPKIQKNIYKKLNYELYLFNAYVNGKKVSWSELVTLSLAIGIPTVPFLGYSYVKDLDEMLEECVGNTILVKDSSVPREGIVWRNSSGDIHFKVKSRPYKVWFD